MQSGSTLEKLPIGKDQDRAALDRARKALGKIILGKDAQIALALSWLLARGHLLIEDLPGLGKTMERYGDRGDEPYIFHFPDGNASITE